MYTDLKRTWAEIDLSALEHNYTTLRRRVQTKFLGVVKADAYGHGAVEVSRCLQDLGVDYLAVSSLDEARELAAQGTLAERMLPPDYPLGHLRRADLPDRFAKQVAAGAKIPVEGIGADIPEHENLRVYLAGAFWGIMRREGGLLVWRAQIAPETAGGVD